MRGMKRKEGNMGKRIELKWRRVKEEMVNNCDPYGINPYGLGAGSDFFELVQVITDLETGKVEVSVIEELLE